MKKRLFRVSSVNNMVIPAANTGNANSSNEMAGYHHQLNGHEFEQILGHSEGQGSLVHCSSWVCKESDMT